MVEYWKDRAPALETTSLLCFISQLLLGEERGIPSGGEKPNKCYQCDFASSLGQVIWRLIQEHTHYRQLPCFVLSLEQLLPGTPSALFPSFLDVNVLVIFSKFLSDPGKPGVRSMGPDVRNKLRDVCVDLTDVTLADEDTNSILTDNANRAIQGNVAI